MLVVQNKPSKESWQILLFICQVLEILFSIVILKSTLTPSY